MRNRSNVGAKSTREFRGNYRKIKMKATTLPRTRRGSNGNGNGNGHGAPPASPETPQAAAAASGKKAVELVKLERESVTLKISSETGLIVHNFTEKAIQMMLDKQMGKATTGRAKKNPVEDFRGSLYKMQNGTDYGFPARGFKACFVKAANDVDLVKTEMKRAIRVLGTGDEAMNVDGLVKICSEPLAKEHYTPYDLEHEAELVAEHKYGISMRRDMVRLETGVADIRFRAWFPKWWALIKIQWNKRVLSHEQLLALVDAAGFGVGIGEWRPGAPKSESGQFGCFCVQIDHQA